MNQRIVKPDLITGTTTGEDVDSSSDSIAIPTVGGVSARRVLITVSTATYVSAGNGSGGTITNANGILVTPESGGLIMDVVGSTHIYHIRSAADGRITITPLE